MLQQVASSMTKFHLTFPCLYILCIYIEHIMNMFFPVPGLDSSVSGAQTVQQTASTMFSSNTSCNLPAITECDSSGISK